MGNAISSGTKYCTSFLVGKAKYILNLEDNLDALHSDVQLLEARKIDLENKIKLEERKGLQCLQEVLVWLLRVEAIQSEVRDLLDARTVEVERLSMCGYCSNDFILTYRYGKKVSENLEKVKGFLSSKSFEVVAWEGMPHDIEEDPSQSTTSLPSDIEEEPSQSTTSLPSDIDDPHLSTIGLLSDIEKEPSHSTTALPSGIEEGVHLAMPGLPPDDIEEDPSQSTIKQPSDIEEVPSQSTTSLLPDMEEDPSQSTTGLPSNRVEDPSQSTTGLAPNMDEDSSQSTIGFENMLERTWKRLMEDKVGILGLYGMGGIGKTTLLKQIKKKFLIKRDEFDEVIYVVVTQDLHIGRIQQEIGNRLGLWNDKWEKKTKAEKASDIKRFLVRKRFVILLDDIWEKVELQEIGIPLPSTQNRSKVVYTSRSRKVCGRMGPNDVEVKCLDQEVAWKLFQQKVRPSTIESDPNILKLARIVCGKCNGLPLALNVIGETMACKTTVYEWQHVVDVLTSNADVYPEFKEEIFKTLKLSYDYLEDKVVQQCLLYCALFPEDYKIEKDRLVDYWICEGIINGGGPRAKAVAKGYDIIGILVSACLLINHVSDDESLGEAIERVKIHVVIRQMALWIASNFVVKSGAGLHQMPEFENWNAVRRMSLEDNQIETISVIPDCPHLTTLILKKNKLVSISGTCFLSMPKLVVLDLSWNRHLKRLPEEVSKLVNLRYLGLAGTRLKELPTGLRELIQLRHLDLDYMRRKLRSISMISRLLNLETLKAYNSIPISLASIKDIELLKKLKFLSVTIIEVSILECFLSTPRLASCTQRLYLDLDQLEAENVFLAATAASLCTLWIEGCSVSYLMEDTRFGYRSSSAVSFQNLQYVTIVNVSGIQDLTWLLFAPSLTALYVGRLTDVREIISREKVSGIINEGSGIIPFRKLRELDLFSLPELTSIYWEPLVFPVLTAINIRMCPKLKKLPLNKESSKGNRLCLQSNDRKWLDGLEWEDEETKDRFLHQDQVSPYTSALQLERELNMSINMSPIKNTCSIM